MMSNILNRSFRTHRRTHSTPPGRMVTATVTDRIPRNNTLSASGAALNDVPEDEELRSGGRRQSSVALVSATASTTPVPIQDTKVSLAMYATLNASGGALPKNRDWLRLQHAIRRLFKNKDSCLEPGEMAALHEKIRTLASSKAGPFLFDSIKHEIEVCLTAFLRKLQVVPRNKLLDSLSSEWENLFRHILPTLDMILYVVKGKGSMTVRQAFLVVFRDAVVTKLDLEDLINEETRLEVPEGIRHMLLILYNVSDSYPPSKTKLKLEGLLARLLVPFLGFQGLYEGTPEPTVKSAEPEVAARRKSAAPFRLAASMELSSTATVKAAILVVIIWLVIVSLKKAFGRPSGSIPNGARLPPGPSSLPLLGNIETLINGLSACRALAWSRTYGPVIRVRRLRRQVMGRKPPFLIETVTWTRIWKTGHERSHRCCRLLLSEIAKSQGEPIDLFDLILASTSSNISVFLIGYRYPLGHQEHQRLCRALRNEFTTSRSVCGVLSFPFLTRTISRYLPLSLMGKIIGAMRTIEDFASTHLLHHMETLDDKEDRDFMDAYLRKCKEHDQHSASTHNYIPGFLFITVSALTGNVVTFLLAGAITAAASLMRELLLVAANVDTIQARIQREVTDAVGGERKPSWEDRLSTPYTMAFIWEAHRRYPMLPLGVPRRACQDVIIGEYFIPENATVVTNTWALHHDPAIWKDPNKFDPTRFLKSDGSLSQDELQRVIPFSVGRRMCPGEIFASAEIYIYLTSILQKYRIVPISGTNVHVDCKYSDIMKLGRHKMRCIPRTNVTQ
ncbi:cytochrome P450 2A13 isoform X3 [Rhipicephalus microplus]|uniref:cytochrome P450 2A13 isoform X3 n=1 Tax=Rhipicephalus microplus TaxID=6941 RepID=UPI003F6C3BBA